MFHVEHCLVHPLHLSYPQRKLLPKVGRSTLYHSSNVARFHDATPPDVGPRQCSTWNTVSSTHPPGYPQLCSLLTLSLISTFRCPILVLHLSLIHISEPTRP